LLPSCCGGLLDGFNNFIVKSAINILCHGHFFSKRRVVLSSQHVSSHWPENYEGLALTSKKPIKQGRPNWEGWMALKFWLPEENIDTNKQYLTLKIEDLPPSL
jgi:hypothetical protein